jgi:hypothetical protein
MWRLGNMADTLYVFLVSGNPAGSDDGFARCAWLRVAELVKHYWNGGKPKAGAPIQKDSVLRFIHFDSHLQGGVSVGVYEHDFTTMKGIVQDPLAKRVARNWVILDKDWKTKFGTLDKAHDPKEFIPWKEIQAAKTAAASLPIDQRHPISIVDVYHTIRKAPPGSVLELSIFSHAFADGPVLYNTFASDDSILHKRRDPDDTDGRADVDFQANMGESGAANTKALDEFKNAFHKEGAYRIWGCNIQDIVVTKDTTDTVRRCLILNTVREVVEAAFVVQKKDVTKLIALKLRDSKLPAADTQITLNIEEQIQFELSTMRDPATAHAITSFPRGRLYEIRYDETFTNHKYHDLFRGERDSKGDFAKTIVRTLSDVIKFVAAETLGSYFFVAAQALKTVTVVGGPPGTSAEVDTDGQQVINGTRAKDCAKFFEKFMGVSITDPDNNRHNNYAFLDNKGVAVAAILERAAHGIDKLVVP